jgi:putative proteasome-type protease
MTLCLAMKVKAGLVGLADTRVTSGTERITARKLTFHERENHSMFIMTSGLRAIRDKAVTYFDEALEEADRDFDKMYKAVNAFAQQIRRVADEDREAITSSGLRFDLSSLVGGQLERDQEHKLYLLYPQGNWVEVSRGTPFFSIGEGAYGKSLLDRALTYETSMEDALKIAFLAFDATRTSATDVDFPIDVVLYVRNTHRLIEHRYTHEELSHVSEWWQKRVRHAIDECPRDWVGSVFSKLRDTILPFERTSE